MTNFTRRAPKANNGNGGYPAFGGRENNQIGDSFIGIFAGLTAPSKEYNKQHYIFLDENKDYAPLIVFSCKSIDEQMPYYQIGDRIQVTLTGRFEGTKGLAKGKMIVQYDVQVDDSFEPTQEILDLCDKAVGAKEEPKQVAKPAPARQPTAAPARRTSEPVKANNFKSENPFG